jgi:hypothetical protein
MCSLGYGALPSFGGFVTSVVIRASPLAGYATGDQEDGFLRLKSVYNAHRSVLKSKKFHF